MEAHKKFLLSLSLFILLPLLEACSNSDYQYGNNDWFADPFWKIATADDVQKRIAQGADIHHKDRLKATPLHTAAMYAPDPEVIDTLIKNGASPNTIDIFGQTPLFYAIAFNENPEIIKALIKGGTDVNAKDIDGNTPLSFARTYNFAAIEMLRNAGAR